MDTAVQNKFSIVGLERVSFAVADSSAAARFAEDWGLTRPDGSPGFVYSTPDGSEIEVVQDVPRRSTERPVDDESGVCRITWGLTDPAKLAALAEDLGTDRPVNWRPDGSLDSVDDLGIPVSFRLTRKIRSLGEPTRYNSPLQTDRINRRGARYQRAKPSEVSHIAIGVDNAGEASCFYIERLGFIVSDRYANRGVFLRCAPMGNHHHLFLMNSQTPGVRLNHVAFKVRDIHEVIAGGQYMDARGWRTFAGPGRHLVSTALFWYFQTPLGCCWEYSADEDMVTEHWRPADFVAQDHIFSEWTFGLEKSDGTLKRGPIALSREGNTDQPTAPLRANSNN